MLAQLIKLTTTANKKKSGGSKKIGRNKAACSRYRAENRWEKNKVRRFKNFLKRTKQLKLWTRVKGIKDWDIIKLKIGNAG